MSPRPRRRADKHSCSAPPAVQQRAAQGSAVIGGDAARAWLDVVAVAAARRPEACTAQHSGALSRDARGGSGHSCAMAGCCFCCRQRVAGEAGMLDAARQSHLGRPEAGAAVLAPVCGCCFDAALGRYAFPLAARIPCDGAGFGWTRPSQRAVFCARRVARARCEAWGHREAPMQCMCGNEASGNEPCPCRIA